MKTSNVLIIMVILLTGCTNIQLKSDYQIFFNDYSHNKSYLYLLQDKSLIKKYQYQGIIEEIKKDNNSYYLQMNKNLKKYLELSNDATSKRIDIKNEYPVVYHPNKQDIYYSSNYLNNNFLVKKNFDNKIEKYLLKNYFINHLLFNDSHLYLFIERQNDDFQHLLVLDEQFNKVIQKKLKEKISLNAAPFIYQNKIYYLSNKNKLIKVSESFNFISLLKLKESFPHKLVINNNYLYYSNFDTFDQKQKNVITKLNIDNHKTTKKYFKHDIVDLKIKNNNLLVLNKRQLIILNKSTLKQSKIIRFNLKFEAIKVQ